MANIRLSKLTLYDNTGNTYISWCSNRFLKFSLIDSLLILESNVKSLTPTSFLREVSYTAFLTTGFEDCLVVVVAFAVRPARLVTA